MIDLNNYRDFLLARNISLNYYNVMKIFFSYCKQNNIDFVKITQEDITNFYNQHSDYSKRTKTQFIQAGRHCYTEFLGISKEDNEWYKLKYFKGHFNTPKFLSLEELSEIIKYFGTYENRLMNPFKAETFITFIYMTGLRKSEILSLKRTDINLEKNPCEIKIIGKGDKERFVYFAEKYSPKLKQRLIEYFDSEPEEVNAFNMTKGKITYFVNKMNKYLKDRKITPHLFRHSFGKYLLDKGVPITYISRMYGHSSLQTTMIYLNPTNEQIKKFMK